MLFVSAGDRAITHVMGERFMDIETILVCLLEQSEIARNRQFWAKWQIGRVEVLPSEMPFVSVLKQETPCSARSFALELIGIEEPNCSCSSFQP